MTYLRALAAAAVLLCSACQPAFAQERACPSLDQVIESLGEYAGERPRAAAMIRGLGPVMLLVGPDGTWTMIATLPNGCTAIVMVGDRWIEKPAGQGI